MGRRRTILEARFPETADFAALAQEWLLGAVDQMLGFVWRAYDRIVGDILSRISLDDADKDLERVITMTLVPLIRNEMSGDEAYHVEHEWYEHETMLDPPARPPQYDICFVWRECPRFMWPLEAKLLRTDGSVSKYVKEIRDNFLTCRYAPFTGEGGMLGYLVAGDPERALSNIAAKIPCQLRMHPSFPDRDHRTSEHSRNVPHGKDYPRDFRCHHLILPLAK